MEVQIATVLSGLRWSLTQILLDKEDMGMNNPLATNLFLSPLMAISLFFASLASEGIHDLSSSPFFESFHSALSILTVIAFGGVIAFFMMTLEFQLISYTSVVTFSIAGIVKEILTIGVSHLIFNDRFTGTAPWGLAISLIGICGYNYLRINAMFLLHKSRRKERRQLRSLDRIVEGAVGIGGGEEEGEADDDIIDHQAAVNSNKVLFALEEED